MRLRKETYEITATPRGEREISGRVALVTGGAQARGAGIEVDARQYEGGHGWVVWSAALADEVDWLGERLGLV